MSVILEDSIISFQPNNHSLRTPKSFWILAINKFCELKDRSFWRSTRIIQFS